MRTLWLRTERCVVFNVIRLFRIRRASERVARGFALGLVVNFFPTFGLGVLISGFVARLFGGNAAAGLVGGSTLTFFWPVLFYFNLRTGAWLEQRRAPVAAAEALTPQEMDALAWGRTFTLGAVGNSVVAGLAVYVLLRLLYERARPGVLAWFRRHAREHQRQFSLHRARRGG